MIPTVRAAAVAVVLVLAAACTSSGGSPVPAAAGGSDEGDASAWVVRTPDDALFTVDCPFSHRASDDPIVFPGEPGASHVHDFFGSRATDAASTGPSLRGTATTCEDHDDTAAYWVPALMVGGRTVEPSLVRAYYRAPIGADARQVAALPLGLAMLVGDAHRTEPRTGDPGVDGTDAPPDPAGDPHGGGHAPPTATGTNPEETVEEIGWGCGLRPRQMRALPPTDCTDRSP